MIDSDAHRARHLRLRRGVELGVLLGEDRLRALGRLVEEVGELHRVPRARLEHLLVLAQHRPEGHVFGARRRGEPAGHPRDGEDHGQVLLLRRAHDVEEARRAEGLRAKTDRREVAGCIAVASVLFADDEGQGRAVFRAEALREDAHRAVARDEEALLLELHHDVVEERIVEALAANVGVGQGHAEALVDHGEVTA